MRLRFPFRALPRPRLGGIVTGVSLLAAGAVAALPVARAFAPGGPAGAEAAAAAGPVSTAALGARCIGAAFDDTPAFQAAIDTGHTVYAPALGGQCHITRPLVMKTPGQIFHGDGRARTKILIQPGFKGEGVFVAQTGEPGPVWRDFSVSFVQPDTDDRAKLTRYPPAFFAPDTPRFQMEHVGCYVATACIDMKGNSGGATIADLQMSAFEVGIDIDGSLDTVRITDPHWWPFGMTQKHQKIFAEQGYSRSIGLRVGRMDDLVVRGGLFAGGAAILLTKTPAGEAFGTIDQADFDSASGIVAEAGSFIVADSFFGMALSGAQAINQSGASLSVSSSRFYSAGDTRQPLVAISSGDLMISNSKIATGAFDQISIRQSGTSSFLLLTGDLFARNSDIAYEFPTIQVSHGRIIARENFATDKGRHEASFVDAFEAAKDSVIDRNSSPGWRITVPSRP